MYTLFISNTIPCYYINFKTQIKAFDFKTALKIVGNKQGINYQCRILTDFPFNEKFNGYNVEKMNESIYKEILEMIHEEFKR